MYVLHWPRDLFLRSTPIHSRLLPALLPLHWSATTTQIPRPWTPYSSLLRTTCERPSTYLSYMHSLSCLLSSVSANLLALTHTGFQDARQPASILTYHCELSLSLHDTTHSPLRNERCGPQSWRPTLSKNKCRLIYVAIFALPDLLPGARGTLIQTPRLTKRPKSS
jgi:hypothetical protein